MERALPKPVWSEVPTRTWEATSPGKSGIARYMARIYLIIMNYALPHVWNAGAFGIFYRQPPTWTLLNRPVASFKKEKTYITFLSCYKNDGSEHTPLLIIGRG